MAEAWATNSNENSDAADIYVQWKDRVAMEVPDNTRSIRGEEDPSARKQNFRVNPPPDQATSMRARLPVYSASTR